METSDRKQLENELLDRAVESFKFGTPSGSVFSEDLEPTIRKHFAKTVRYLATHPVQLKDFESEMIRKLISMGRFCGEYCEWALDENYDGTIRISGKDFENSVVAVGDTNLC